MDVQILVTAPKIHMQSLNLTQTSHMQKQHVFCADISAIIIFWRQTTKNVKNKLFWPTASIG